MRLAFERASGKFHPATTISHPVATSHAAPATRHTDRMPTNPKPEATAPEALIFQTENMRKVSE